MYYLDENSNAHVLKSFEIWNENVMVLCTLLKKND